MRRLLPPVVVRAPKVKARLACHVGGSLDTKGLTRPRLRLTCRWYLLPGALLAGVFATAPLRAAPTPAERDLPNLSSASTADPLPRLRANRPAAAEMAARPRVHPYLFFDASTRGQLRDRARTEPFLGLAQRVRTLAEDCLKRSIPPLAKDYGDITPFLPNGNYNPEFLRHNTDDFYDQADIVSEVIPALGFAYQLTGDQRFGEAGREWLLNFARRETLVRKMKAADFSAGYAAFGMALGYDWLWELLSEPERRQVQLSLAGLARPIVAAAAALLRAPAPERSRGSLGNNHRTRTHGLFGLTPLALLYEHPEAAEWLDLEIQLHRDRLYPSAWAPNGEHLDGRDHFESSLDDPMPFLAALRQMGGENLFDEPNLAPRFRGISHGYLYGLEFRVEARPEAIGRGGRLAGSGWLALARHARDPVAQWIATQSDGLQRLNPVIAYLLYDPTLAATPPVDPSGSLYFPYSGLVKMTSGWGDDGILIPFRCGPEIGKDVGDQNGFRFRAGGEWLAPRLAWASPAPDDPHEFKWDLWAWFSGSPAQNVILPEPDGIGDYATLRRKERLLPFTGVQNFQGGIQYAGMPPMKGRDYPKQWLSGPEIQKNGVLRVVSFSPDLDYVCGEAHRAYAYFRPALWVRHLLFVKDSPEGRHPYILVCDEIEAGEDPRSFAWQLHLAHPFSLDGRELAVQGSRSSMTVHFLAPSDGPLIKKETPAPLPNERTHFVQWRTPQPQKRAYYLVAMVPQTSTDQGRAPLFRMVDAAGGWAVEVTSGTARDIVLFRSERAASVSAQGVGTTGTAAVFRNAGPGPALLFHLGKPPR